MPSIVEVVWNAAHASSLFPTWAVFQVVAVTVGAALTARQDRRALVPFAVGVVLALPLAIVFANGGAWARWLAGGLRGPWPELELAGFGALAGLVVGPLLVAPVVGLRRGAMLDLLAPAVGAMLAIARLGCFFAGCDFGAPTTASWALRYPHLTPAFRAQLEAGLITRADALTLPVHPTQLYEAALGVGLLALALVLGAYARLREGWRLAIVVGLYAVGRMVIDVFRGDLVEGRLGLTSSQLLGLAALGVVAFALSRATARGVRYDMSRT